MSAILPSERRTAKARIFIALVYAALALGGVTMVLPFAVMVASSFSCVYDYDRHSPGIRALFDRNDRFMRSLSYVFKRFPRDVYPDAPAHWTTWASVAADRDGIDAFAARHLAPADDPETFARWKSAAADFREFNLRYDITNTVCTYDPRDVARFVRDKYSALALKDDPSLSGAALRDAALARMNAEWPVRYKSFFDVSFIPESQAPLGQRSWRAPSDAKFRTWIEFKDACRRRAYGRGDWICPVLPHPTPAGGPPERLHGKTPEGEWAAAYGRGGRFPLREALAVQFVEHGWRDFFRSAFSGYALVSDYIFVRGRAFFNTLLLVALSVLAHLTVNPLAAYALSRFAMRGTRKILLFLLATMAFPAAVTAVPGFLLVRDLGLLNTMAALVLPTVASGMSIFILKGFFDALPRELYEAAAIDGASEWTVFRRITLPLTTPILAVNALTSFVAAYNSWEWAFLVCQKESGWTLAVWLYQMSINYAGQPWCVMAGFVLVSIPTAAVFLLCQKVILRGIVLPSMK